MIPSIIEGVGCVEAMTACTVEGSNFNSLMVGGVFSIGLARVEGRSSEAFGLAYSTLR